MRNAVDGLIRTLDLADEKFFKEFFKKFKEFFKGTPKDSSIETSKCAKAKQFF